MRPRATSTPTAAAAAPRRAAPVPHARLLRRALEDEYLGWMDTPRGRRTFVDFFANYHVPAVPELAAGLGRIDCPDRGHLGRPRPLHPVFDRARAGRAHPRRDADPANRRRSLHHGGTARRGDRGAAGTAGTAMRHCPCGPQHWIRRCPPCAPCSTALRTASSSRRPTRYQVCMTPLPLMSTSPRSSSTNACLRRS